MNANPTPGVPGSNPHPRVSFRLGVRMSPLRWLLVLVCLAASGPRLAAQPFDGRLLSGMQWRMVGPFRGGRVLTVAGVPGHPDRFYFGSVGGGVWRSDNAGRTWEPVFDGQPGKSGAGKSEA